MKVLWITTVLSLLILAVSTASARSPDFETEVAPLLIRRCVECHQGADPSGGLSLTSRAQMSEGGDSGPLLDSGAPQESMLLQRVIDGEMPPEQQGRTQRLSGDEIHVLERWVASGAPWPEKRELDFFERTNDRRAGRDWWSLQPIVKPVVPKLSPRETPQSPIDAFIGATLQSASMVPAPSADPETRLRRLYIDLIGLSPTRHEIDTFLAEPSLTAWERKIDELLDSPQYGVRWARYWLDLVRYADTSGYERDQEKPYAWKYRDWVVDAFNSDLPYDQFIVQQLAGDEIESKSKSSLIATGFLRLGTWNDEPNDPADYVYDRLEDLVHTTSSAFLGMTVKCARCHSHKFDPITQDDYYRMASAFWTGPIDRGGKSLGGPTAEELGYDDVLAWTDTRVDPPPLHVLKSGERDKPLNEIVPSSLSILPALQRTFDTPPPNARSTKRRLQLARWITDPQNPLTARVLVNRLWQYHFGEAIVRTPNNFGFLADPPTHPELLDWLAAELVNGGWRLKPMHKMILMSQTWQQASVHPRESEYRKRDAGNRLWWRAQRRRLDAESLRDGLLASSGELDLSIGGSGFRPTISSEALEGLSRKNAAWEPSPESQQRRRSLYLFTKRGLLPPMMTTFDMCDSTQSCGKRDTTTVPTQALAMMNNDFVFRRGVALAENVTRRQATLAEQVDAVWLAILRRPPTPDEHAISVRHVEQQLRQIESGQADVLSLASLAHVLFNSNEFLYVD